MRTPSRFITLVTGLALTLALGSAGAAEPPTSGAVAPKVWLPDSHHPGVASRYQNESHSSDESSVAVTRQRHHCAERLGTSAAEVPSCRCQRAAMACLSLSLLRPYSAIVSSKDEDSAKISNRVIFRVLCRRTNQGRSSISRQRNSGTEFPAVLAITVLQLALIRDTYNGQAGVGRSPASSTNNIPRARGVRAVTRCIKETPRFFM